MNAAPRRLLRAGYLYVRPQITRAFRTALPEYERWTIWSG